MIWLLIWGIWANQAQAQSIAPAADGTGTIVTPNGSQLDITGGKISGDNKNLFHSFTEFGLKTDEIANFLSNSSIQNILGRVTGGDASIINGLIQVTGGNSNLFLMNPAGIIFGANAQLNVPASFTATTATSIGFGNNNWFKADGINNYTALTGTPGNFAFNVSVPGSIINAGNLAVSSGQDLTFVGGNVINTGTLTAQQGKISIVAVPGSSQVKISQPGHLLSLEIDSADLEKAGETQITPATLAQLLTGEGGTEADGVTINNDQLVVTDSGISVPVAGGVENSKPLVIASGSLDVSGQTGGSVNILGDHVGVIGANINASGTNGGGTVLVGGDYQGKGTVPNASATFVSSDSTINASALQSGDGGRVIIWADNGTRFFGNISARGGVNAGDGGFVEVSGKENLEFAGIVDTTATSGQMGTLLLDPKNIVIKGGGPDPVAGQTFDNPTATSTISGASLSAALNLASVSLQANNDITIDDNITATTAGNGLSLQAGRSITLNANRTISLNGGNFSAKINDENAIAAQRDAGFAQFVMNTGSKILTNGGNVTIAPGTFGGSAIGEVRIFGATINSGSGNILMAGRARSVGSDNIGIFLDQGSIVESTGAGTITLNGTGGAGTNDNRGIWLDEASRISSVNGNINLTGTGQGSGESNQGIYIFDNSVVRSTGTGNITLIGTGSTTGTQTSNDGIAVIDFGLVEATGTGSITLIGTSGVGSKDNNGIKVANANIRSVDGDINLAGTGNGAGINHIGVILFNNGVVQSTGKGNITLTGIGANGAEGILLDKNSSINPAGTSTGKVTLTADEISLLPTTQIEGKGVLQLQPLNPGLGISVGGATIDANLNLDTAELKTVQNGFSQIIIGRDNSSGAITLNPHTFNDPVKIQTPVDTGTITSTPTGAIAGTGDASITLVAKTNITLNSTLSSTGSLTLISDEINLLGGVNSVSSNGAIALQPITPGLNITIGGIANDTSLNLDNTDIAALQDGFNKIEIGLVNGTGTLTLDNTATFNDPVNLAGGSTLVGANKNNTWNITGKDAGSIIGYPNGLTFASIENLVGGADIDTFKVNNGGFISGNIDGSTPFDTLDYSAYTNPVTVTLGTNSQATATGIGGTVFNIENLIGGTSGNNTLNGANIVNNWNITGASSGDVNGITFSAFQKLIGAGDTDNFILGTLGSDVTIDGNLGTNNLIGANKVNTINITENNSGNVNNDAIAFSNIQNLTGGTDTDTFKFSEGKSISGIINGNVGFDTLDYSAYTSPLTLNLANFLNIENSIGGAANDTLIATNTVNNWNITGLNAGDVNGFNFSSFENLTGGTETDIFTLGANGAVAKIDGNAGNNILVGANTNNTWNITGNNSGNVNDANSFTNIQNLAGGSIDDSFKFTNNGYISGNIDGVNTTDTLDYSDYTNPVTVTLGTNNQITATGVGGTLTSIENLVGGSSNNTLIGAIALNTWNITGLNAGDVNGFNFSGFENLTGGIETDIFTLGANGVVAKIDGNTGNNILVGANTNNTWNITGNNSGNVNGANSFTNIQNLTGGSIDDSFKFTNNGYISGNIDGVNTTDTLDYSDYTNPVTVTLGTNNQITAIGVGGILISIENLVGGTGNSTLIGANTANTWNITDNNSGDVNGGVAFSGFQNLTGGGDTDNFVFSDGKNISGIIDGKQGFDTVNYSAYNTPVTLNVATLANVENSIGGTTAEDNVIGSNTANKWNIAGVNTGDVNGLIFTSFETVTGGTDTDTFTVNGGSVSKIDGSAGNNTVVAANTVNKWKLNGANSGDVNGVPFINVQNVTGGTDTDTFELKEGVAIAGIVDGNAGNDTLDYSTYTGEVTVDMGASKATGVATVSKIEKVVGGTSGDNTFIGPNTKNTWNLTSNDSGDVNGVTFSNFQNLTGGTANDTFKFSDAVNITGIVDGGAGFDDLDYTAYTTPFVVDLQAGTATGTGGIKNIDPPFTAGIATDLQGETSPPISVENQDTTPVLCVDQSLEGQMPKSKNLSPCQSVSNRSVVETAPQKP
ncbi:filamentous hemagglutinin N-terminal domain-containing protein [Coleofasciculus sp. FACHB-1120]|uniref:two-partner secretion domain-containing protein n=1 Tax=Coleofasciculus sp. FACHB-1120 TaxID=2692783 RepID=UPI0016825C81|nr:filamentous hemagglutinin N-terminal domain-containing protein [Coleofasciculus sp. FACHB-1120]MBD2744473.1 filamentous hemagglutinin N-terminal domain-containing protein [Coleofasciculus sp. FACHB-1120]